MVPGQVVYVVKSQLWGLGGGDACYKVPIPWGWEVNLPQAHHKCGLGRAGRGTQQRQGRLSPPPILAQRGHLRVTILVGCGSLGLNTLALDGVL